MKKVCVVGLGYIGLPTAIVAAHNGYEVIGFDIDEQRVARINAGDPVIEEPEIGEKLLPVIKSGRLYASTIIREADCFIIAVPTPFHDDKTADLAYVWAAGESVASVIKKGDVVILESTVPVGTTEKLAHLLVKKSGLENGIDFFVAHCPERVLPGNIFRELVVNARIIGGIDQQAMHKAKEFYKKFVSGPLYLTNAATAEMVKLVENSSRDTQIAFANQVAAMAYSMNLNPFEVIELANKHPRVNILNPSCGVGGHCIAVDPWFLIETFDKHTRLLRAAREINDQKPMDVVAAVRYEIADFEKKRAKKPSVLLLGLTYKPDIDDIRESPALLIAEQLIANQIDIMVHEPHVDQETCQRTLGRPSVSLIPAIAQADIIVCLVKHTVFKALDRKVLGSKIVLDICGLLYERHNQIGQEQIYWPAHNDFYRMYRKDGA
jgi:UDP-N-acetyl-D-mannosaminuronic acid dehydrogenase